MLDGDCFPIAPFCLPAPARSSGSGGQRLKRKNELPKVFLLASGKPRVIFGAVLVTTIAEVLQRAECVAVLGSVCLLQAPLEISGSDCVNRSAVFRLKPQVELAVRRSPALCGGSLNDNFIAYAATEWRVWPVSPQVQSSLSGPCLPQYIPAERKHASAIGVEITHVNIVLELIHDMDIEPDDQAADVPASSDQAVVVVIIVV